MYLFKLIGSVKATKLGYNYFRSVFIKNASSSSVDVNTNVAKDVILFKYENPKFFKMLNLFSFCQFGFWSYLSLFSFQTLRDAPASEELDASWFRRINLGENKYKNTIAVSAFMIGKVRRTPHCRMLICRLCRLWSVGNIMDVHA